MNIYSKQTLIYLVIVTSMILFAACSSSDDPVGVQPGDDCDEEGAIDNNLICHDGSWVDSLPPAGDVGVDDVGGDLDASVDDTGGDDHDDVGETDDTGTDDTGIDDTGTDDTGTDDAGDPDAGDDDVGEECEPESDEEFCDRHQVECGSFSGDDNCDDQRTVDCADTNELACVEPEICLLADDDAELDTNICACPEIDDSDPSAVCTYANAECGMVTPGDICNGWSELDDVDCGECTGDAECGTDIPNICGCPCEIDGVCYADGDTDGDDVCSVCDSTQSTDAFVDAPDGTDCDSNAVCHSGDCVCDDGFTLCDGECVDTDTDLDHCGTCNDPCSTTDPNAEAMCTAGSCEVECTDCEIGGVCVADGDTDDGDVCSICDPSQSTDTFSDAPDGTDCGPNSVCHSGDCVCDDGFTLCSGECVDTETDLDHCGDCGEPCTTGESDAEAMCVDSSCDIECNDDSLTYCPESDTCTDTQTDPENCGTCGNTCGGTTACEAGQCDQDDTVMEVIDVSTGFQHSCALLASGTVICWGRGSLGQLGDGIDDSDHERREPNEVEGIDNAIAISTGRNFSCALLQTGEVQCWGQNSYGQLGNGTAELSAVPTPVSEITDASTITTGNEHACAIEDGQVYCWGRNSHGRLGDGTKEQRLEPVPVSDELPDSAILVSASYQHSCALADGDVYCWGNNSAGRLGDGTQVQSDIPVEVIELPYTITDVVTGNSHNCAVTDVGNVFCWGNGTRGQLGDGNWDSSSTPVGVQGIGGTVDRVSAGINTSCALRSDGEVYCWGRVDDGRLGIGDVSDDYNTAQHVSNIQNVQGLSISTANSHTCAILEQGQLACWGLNDYGQLGDNQRADSAPFNRWVPTIMPTIEPPSTEAGLCFTGQDNSGNGLTDCEDPDCATDLGEQTGDNLAAGNVWGFAGNYTRGTCGPPGPELIYRWTAPTSETYVIDTEGAFAFADLVLYVRQDSCSGFELGCDEGGSTHFATVEFEATEGEQYFIFIQDNHPDGDYQINIAPKD